MAGGLNPDGANPRRTPHLHEMVAARYRRRSAMFGGSQGELNPYSPHAAWRLHVDAPAATHRACAEPSHDPYLVEMTGIEPATFCLQSSCSPG